KERLAGMCSVLSPKLPQLMNHGEKLCHLFQRNHIWTIAERYLRIRVCFDEETINTDCCSCPGQERRKLTLATGTATHPSRLLDRMGNIKNYGRILSHDWQ